MLHSYTLTLFALGALLSTTPAFPAESIPLEGTWNVTITATSAPAGFPGSFPALETYGQGGGMVTSNPLPPVSRPGQGAWTRNGNDCTVVIFFLGVDVGLPVPGFVRVDHKVTLNGKDDYSGSGTAWFHDAAGTLLFSVEFTSVGHRLNVP